MSFIPENEYQKKIHDCVNNKIINNESYSDGNSYQDYVNELNDILHLFTFQTPIIYRTFYK